MTGKICTREELERFGEFMQSKESGKGILVYHGDADGACSAAVFLRFFRDFESIPRKGPIMGKDFVQVLLDKKPELLVFIDLPVDQESGKLEMLLKEMPGLRIAVLDHHIAEKNVNSERILHINPRFHKEDAYIPAACMLYRMSEGMGKPVKPLIWIAAMGTIGDYGIDDCSRLIEECRKEYPFLLEGPDPRDTRLGYGADMIAAAATMKGLNGIAECLKALLSAQGFEDFESVKKLREWKDDLDEEFGMIMNDFERDKQSFEQERLVVFEVKSPLSITSLIATHIGAMLPDRIVVIRKKSGDTWKVSLRNQEGSVNLGDIVKNCVEGIGSGGGHEKAAAGIVNDWDLFLKRLREGLVTPSS